MGFRMSSSGSFKSLNRFVEWSKKKEYKVNLDEIGRAGVTVLARNTPKDTGLTAKSWAYHIQQRKRGYRVTWTNSNEVDGAIVAVLLQYGHATANGGYVPGIDYINPAMKLLFDDFLDEIWKEIQKA